MSDVLPIGIKVDPGDSAAKAKSVEDALHKTEDRAEHLSKQVTTLAGSFRSLGEAIQQHMTSKAMMAGQAMRSLGEAIALESRMLEMATGKSRDYGAQLVSLQRLHEQGKISTEQYIRSLEKLGVTIERMPTPKENAQRSMNTIGLPDAPSQRGAIGSAVDKFGASVVAGAAGLGAITAVQQLAAIDDEYTNLSNSALKFTDAGHNVAMVLQDQRDLAHDLHSGLKETLGGYDAVRDATDDLNLTYSEQLRLTQTIGEAAAIGGKSAEELASNFHNLKVAIETGQDPGRALVTLFKQYPDLADQMASSMGRSRREIVDMAKAGRLSFDEMTRSLIANTEGIDAKFGKRAVTWGHNWEELRDAVEKPFDTMGTINAFMNVDAAINRVTQDIAKQAAHWQELEDAKNKALTGSYTATRLDTSDQRAADLGRSRDEEVRGARLQIEALNIAFEKGRIPAFQYQTQLKALNEVLYGPETKEGISAYEQALNSILEPQRKAIEEYNLLGQALMNHPELYEQINVELGKRRDLLLELGFLEAKAQTKGLPTPVNDTAGIDTASLSASGGVDWEAMRANLDKSAQGLKAMQDAANEIKLQKLTEQGEKLGAAFAPLKNTLVDAFKTGELSADKLLDTLDDIALKILTMGALQAIGPGGGAGAGFLRGLLGGKTGFDYTVGSDPLQRPGFATGGDFRIGGPGGTDSRLIQFWGTPGETVHVRTPQQQQAAAAPQAAPVAVDVAVIAQNNERDVIAAGSSYGAQRVYVANQRKYGRRSR